MRRRLPLLLLLVCSLTVLAACQNQKASSPYTPDLIQAISEAGAFSEPLEELDGDTAFALYHLADSGLSREALTDCAVLRSSGATCEEGAVLVLDSAEHASLAKQALQDYVTGQIDSNRDYRPQEIPKLENALIDQRENTVLLLVANDLECAQTVLD